MAFRNFLAARGLGAWLALGFSLLSLLLTLILVQVIGVAASDQVKVSIGNGLAELAIQTADKLDRSMFERYREVRLMAQRADVVAAGADPLAARRTLESLQATYPYYAWIGMADLSGRVRVATKGMLEGADVSKRPWFGNALQGTYLGDVHEAVLLARLLPGPAGEPKRFVDVAFPYAGADGKPAGVLGAHLSWTWARDIEQSIFAPAAARRRVESIIASGDGKVLLGPEAMRDRVLQQASFRAAAGEAGYLAESWPDGKTYLVGYSRSRGHADYPGLGWVVLVRQDIDDAYERVRSVQRHVFWSGLAVAALFSLVGLLAARRITRPLADLAQAAHRIETGAADALPPQDTPYREVAMLTGSLDALVQNLTARQQALAELNVTLEQRVAQRTAELHAALEDVRLNERRIQTIIDTAQDAYVAVDLCGVVIEWNPAAERMFGWPRADAVGQPLGDLVIPARFEEAYDEALSSLRWSANADFLGRRIERVMMNRRGEEFPVEATIGLVQSGGRHFFSAFLHDISARKKVEQMKNEFISTVSHELRTPLTSIRASLAMLAEGFAGELPEDTRGLIAIAHNSCERLVRLVNDMLDVEKIESGHMHFDLAERPLAPLLEQALAAMEGYAAQHGVTLRLQCEDGLAARVDADRMTQVVTNLLSNAIKFSPRGSAVGLRARRLGAGGEGTAFPGGVRIEVEDRGSGIPEAFRERIFQKFAQADASDARRAGGTGLGLSICKSIVEAHGGSIGFETHAGAGTIFRVDLPA